MILTLDGDIRILTVHPFHAQCRKMAKHTLKILQCEHRNIKGKGYNTNLGIQKKLCECKNNLLKHA